MKITVHCLIKNEENFIWYAINSVLPFAERVIVWDTGSIDKTVQIVKTIKSPKVEFEEKGKVDSKAFANLRQEMIIKTQTDWIMVLDGDEIWWDDSISKTVANLSSRQTNYDLAISSCYMAVGDIFHYQEESAGKYKIQGREGHLNIRFIRNFPELKVHGFYGNEGYSNNRGLKLQNFAKDKVFFSEEKYLHLSHLIRSRKSKSKFKYELGIPFPKDFYYPEVLFRSHPEIVPSPWKISSKGYKLIAGIETPLKKVKRRII